MRMDDLSGRRKKKAKIARIKDSDEIYGDYDAEFNEDSYKLEEGS